MTVRMTQFSTSLLSDMLGPLTTVGVVAIRGLVDGRPTRRTSLVLNNRAEVA